MNLKQNIESIEKNINSADISNAARPIKLAAASGRAFTLIELLVVIAIIGLLASVVLVALAGARQKSRDAKRVADMNQMAKVLELFYNSNNLYPTGVGGADGILSANTAQYLSPNYFGTYPSAPIPTDNAPGTSFCTGNAKGNNVYFYESSAAAGKNYTITFCIGSQVGSLPAGTRVLTPGGFQ